MKSLVTLCSILALAACGGSNGSTTAGSTGTTSASTAETTSGATSGSTSGASGSTSGSGVGTTSGSGANGATSSSGAGVNGTSSSGSGSNGTTSSGSGATGTTNGGGGTTSGGAITYGSSCTLTQTSDPCVAAGYLCSAEFSSTSDTGTCILPTELNPCLAGPGCAQDAGEALDCVTFQFELADGGLEQGNECVQPCTTTTSCVDPITNCQAGGAQSFCVPNGCDPNQAAYAACDAGGSLDGQCYPYPNGGGLICTQTGSAAAFAACDAVRGGANGLCGQDDICLLYSLGGAAGSACLPLCDSANTAGAPTCTSPATCQGLYAAGGPTWGGCQTQCGGTSTNVCPTGSTCNTSADVCL